MNVHSLKNIERLNYVLGGVLIAASAFTMSRAGALGVVVGVVLSCANFSVMRRMVENWMLRASKGKPASSYFLVPKMALLMFAIVVALMFLPIKAEGLLIGFSIFLVSIGIETVRYMTTPPRDEANDAEN